MKNLSLKMTLKIRRWVNYIFVYFIDYTPNFNKNQRENEKIILTIKMNKSKGAS